jgi:hypothetical protein
MTTRLFVPHEGVRYDVVLELRGHLLSTQQSGDRPGTTPERKR